jgi:hypothetical protein
MTRLDSAASATEPASDVNSQPAIAAATQALRVSIRTVIV